MNITNAADIVWLGLQTLSQVVRQQSPKKMPLKEKTFSVILRTHNHVAKKGKIDLKRNQMNGDSEENRLNCPLKVIIATNSMYKICQTMLSEHQGIKEQAYKKVFEQYHFHILNMVALICLRFYCVI